MNTNTEYDFENDIVEEYNDFDDMGLKENLLRGVYGYGFEKPSDIQQKGIVLIGRGGDVIVQSRSGTGKTGTFILSILNKIDETKNDCQAVVLVPTRELADQVQNVCKNLSIHMNIHTILCVGGSSLDENRREFDVKKPKIIIGTPGRLFDVMSRSFFNPDTVSILVMDEADELLSDGFVNQIRDILKKFMSTCQLCLFSATMSDEVRRITEKFMVNPTRLLMRDDEVSLEGIRQFYILVDSEEKRYETFKDLFDSLTISQTMVYVNSKKAADYLQDRMLNENYSVSTIHSQMSTAERADVMRQFRNLKTRVLISTDLLARGIDVQSVSVVINYEIPYKNIENYVHRIGRSGRFGRKGTAINIVLRREYESLIKICNHYGAVINQFPENFTDF